MRVSVPFADARIFRQASAPGTKNCISLQKIAFSAFFVTCKMKMAYFESTFLQLTKIIYYFGLIQTCWDTLYVAIVLFCRCTVIPTYRRVHPAPDHLKCITLSLTLTRSPTSIPLWGKLQWTILEAQVHLTHLHLHPLPLLRRLRNNRLVFEDEWKRILSAPIFIEVERICQPECALLLSP